ncbi:MAG: pyridoxamine 5'-phosphate oxidase family protein [Phycisphaerae bacterium]|nr:pyridoxamine 5'-phosphate oxidase family protein [Phycisphaerae bacterium]
MNLHDYFESTEGIGVLGTADAEGRVDLAIYARPHVADDESVALIMSDRTSHNNIVANPHAAYLFVEGGKGYKGKRLYLTRTHEETDPARIEAVRRGARKGHDPGDALKFLVHFRVEKVRPLTGD